VETIVYLVRHGITEWQKARRVLGQRDIGLNADGIEQSRRAAAALKPLAIGEVIASPMLRAVQTAEIIAGEFGIGVARDPRLTAFRVGRWEGMAYDDVLASPDYQRFVADPLSEQIPGGEHVGHIRDRAVGAVEQAMRDAPAGESVAIVTHAGIVRLLLSHYLGSSLANYHRLRVTPGSISVLSFATDRELPRVLAVNWQTDLGELI
jgi:broad specificity phosphatase PhoE